MKYGLGGINLLGYAHPEPLRRLLIAAEAAGFESAWAAEHVVIPREGARVTSDYSPQRIPADTPFLDPLIALSYAAACTDRLRLATGLIVLPEHNPVLLAKQLASLDVLCNGRLIFGYGVGYVEPEMQAAGVPMSSRGARADEYLAAMMALWREPADDFDGHFVHFEGVDAWPKPIRSRPEIVVGGHSVAALRRAALLADGWYGWRLDLEDAERLLINLREAERKHRVADRPLEVSISPRRPVDLQTAERFAALGVDRLVLLPRNYGDIESAIASMPTS